MFKIPISKHWQKMTIAQAWILVVAGLVLEVPVRWIVRPDMSDLRPGSPWFNLPLRLGIELGFIVFLFVVARSARIPLAGLGITRRRWTPFEWIVFAVIGAIEITSVIMVAGERWPELVAAGVLGKALLWATGEFGFGFNQESGFRGLMMSGLMRLTGPVRATILNTLVFLIGPLHGPGLLELWRSNPEGAAWYTVAVIMTGLLFSWIRYRTDNLILSGVLHGIVNGFLNGSGLARRAYL